MESGYKDNKKRLTQWSICAKSVKSNSRVYGYTIIMPGCKYYITNLQ